MEEDSQSPVFALLTHKRQSHNTKINISTEDAFSPEASVQGWYFYSAWKFNSSNL